MDGVIEISVAGEMALCLIVFCLCVECDCNVILCNSGVVVSYGRLILHFADVTADSSPPLSSAVNPVIQTRPSSTQPLPPIFNAVSAHFQHLFTFG